VSCYRREDEMNDPYTAGAIIIAGVGIIAALGGLWARSQMNRRS